MKSNILFRKNIFRCVDDGFCSLEQADLIQLHVEKKLRKHYKIDEIIGKRLSNDNDNEDEVSEEDNPDKKSLTNDENNTDKKNPTESTKNLPSKTDTDVGGNSNNQTSPSPSKSNLSPGEIKPISPSSLSEASPTSN